MAGSNQWSKVGLSTTSPTSETTRKKVEAVSPKTENILFVGSELKYDSFWLKMMFIAGAYVVASSGRLFRPAHRKTIAYADYGYTRLEKLPLEALKSMGYEVVALRTTDDLVKCFARGREQYKIQDVAFFSHGVVGKISLNYEGVAKIDFDENVLSRLSKDWFVKDGQIYSYACRTGTGKDDYWQGFDDLSEAKPEDSLAQKMANQLGVSVHAYMRRTFYGHVLGAKPRAGEISKALRDWRSEHEGEPCALPPDHEGLPHPGLADSFNPLSGPKREGTDNYALWRKLGGTSLPCAANTPEGLPTEMRIYLPKV